MSTPLQKRRLFIIITIFILIIALPLTLILTRQRREGRSGATLPAPFDIRLTPANTSHLLGSTFDVEVYLSSRQNYILSGYDITLTYTKEFIEVVRFAPTDIFNDAIIPGRHNNDTGELRIAMFDTLGDTIPSNDTILLGRVFFRAKAIGRAYIGLKNISITASRQSQSFSAQTAEVYSYRIVTTLPTQTPTPTIPPTPTILPPPTTCPGNPNPKLCGVVFIDTNRNQQLDADERGLGDVRIAITSGSTHPAIVLTGQNGYFEHQVPVGTAYIATMTVPQNYQATTPLVRVIPFVIPMPRTLFGVISTITPTPSPTLTPTPTRPTTPTVSPTPTPTCAGGQCSTPTPTPTFPPGSTALRVSFTLPGIITGAHRARTGEVIIVNNQNQEVRRVAGNFEFSGVYSATVNLGAFTTGSYIVKLKADNSLAKLIPGIHTLTSGQANTVPQVTLVTGNINQTGSSANRLDITDYQALLDCARNNASCTSEKRALADLNDDGQVEEIDLNILLRGFLTREGD